MPAPASAPQALSRRVFGRGQPRPLAPAPAHAERAPWVEALQQALGGKAITPDSATWDSRRRVFDTRFDPRPQAIALCAGEADLRGCLAVARAHAVPFRIRAGGHSFSGASSCDDLIIDVTGFDGAVIAGQRLTAGGGCKQGNVKALLDQAQLAVPLGSWDEVCLGGFMQGGGFGETSRTHGLNCDHVEAVRVMLADGRIVHADRETNYDLWWAVRGGTGNNFGVLLDITYRLRPKPATASLLVGFSLAPQQREQAVAALLAYQAGFMLEGAPDTVNSSAVIGKSVPPSPAGDWLVFEVLRVGTQAEMVEAAGPLISLPGATTPFDITPLLMPDPMPPFSRASRLIERPVDAEGWRRLLALLDESPNPLSRCYIRAHGGAFNAVAEEASAFIHRRAQCNLFLDVFWQDAVSRAPAEAFQGRWRDMVQPWSEGRIYQNFPEADAPDYAAAYWGRAYPALRAVKSKYDPANLFRHPQAVEPGSRDAVSWPPLVVEALGRPIVVVS